MTNPIQCSDCSANFMRRKNEKRCNSCINRENNSKKKENMTNTPNSEMKILVLLDYATACEIEEICLRRGMSISNYFLGLHNASKSGPESKDNHEELSDLSNEEKSKFKTKKTKV